MGTEISLKEEGSHGFSRIDLVKHSMNSIIHLLGENDFIAIIPFSNKANILLPLTKMDENGKQMALMQVDELEPDDSTNIWDGIRVGLELTKDPICKLNDNVSLLLLTDGEPNINPPRGILPTLEKYIKPNRLNCTIHTFGFGYQLDSAMLNEIARMGSGSYSYIPDCTMVGTVFVNFIANSLSVYLPRSSVRLSPLHNAKIKNIFGYKRNIGKNDQSDEIVDIGSILYGQSRDIILEMEIPFCSPSPYLYATFESANGNENGNEISIKSEFDSLITINQSEISVQIARSFFIEVVQNVIDSLSKSNDDQHQTEAIGKIDQLIKEIEMIAPMNDERISDLLKDIKSEDEKGGQVYQAISRIDWFNKWGKHYLPSLVRSHTIQQCNNFKDAGIQHYGGLLFKDLQNDADDIFCTLTPPEPYQLRKAKQHQINPPKFEPLVDMRNYYNVHGGCFDGNSFVLLQGNQQKQVKNLLKNDKVKTNNGFAKVVCLVQTNISSRKGIEMVDINGMKITPWHPIRWNQKWQFPKNIKESSITLIDKVYNLVLEKDHSVLINDVEVITLGHGNNEDPVLSHPYFATDRVIDDLKRLRGWDEGFVQMNEKSLVRDPNSLLVSRIVV